jgi:hypothetical protein
MIFVAAREPAQGDEAALWGRLPARAVRSQMAWSVSTVEDIDIGEIFIPSPDSLSKKMADPPL